MLMMLRTDDIKLKQKSAFTCMMVPSARCSDKVTVDRTALHACMLSAKSNDMHASSPTTTVYDLIHTEQM